MTLGELCYNNCYKLRPSLKGMVTGGVGYWLSLCSDNSKLASYPLE